MNDSIFSLSGQEGQQDFGAEFTNPLHLQSLGNGSTKHPSAASLAWGTHAEALADWALSRIVVRSDVYGAYYKAGEEFKQRTAHEPLTQALLVRHFFGEITIGAHSLSPPSTDLCKSVAADIDAHDSQPFDADQNLACALYVSKLMAEFGLHPVVFDSNGKGGYWVRAFFKKPIPGAVARWLGDWIKERIRDRGLPDFEWFPKQAELTLACPYGNWIRLPGKHHKRDHWTRIAGSAPDEWLEGEAAVRRLIAIAGDDPKRLLDSYKEAQPAGTKTSSRTCAGAGTRDAPDLETLREALAALPDDVVIDYDSWLHVGMALHHWDRDAGLELWDEWSKAGGSKYEGGACAAKWATFSADLEKGWAVGSIFHLAKQNGWVPPWERPGTKDDRGDVSPRRRIALEKGDVVTLVVNPPTRRTSKRTLVVMHSKDGEIFRDEINFDARPDRDRFVRARCKGWPKSDRDAVTAALLELAGELAEAKVAEAEVAEVTSRSSHGYFVSKGVICRASPSGDGSLHYMPLCDFDARITGIVTHDDGVEKSRRWQLEGAREDGSPLPPVDVATVEFFRGDWPARHWGNRAVVLAGLGNKDHLRAAIQFLSGDVPDHVVFTHTGWRHVDGAWSYLHEGGAVGPADVAASIRVALPEALSSYRLPTPPEGEALIAAVRASLDLARGLIIDATILPLLAATYRSVLAGVDFSLHVVGVTGARKTELATLMQQHFGADMHARQLPANWESTDNALEGLLFSAKDALVVIDDFNPKGGMHDVAKYHQRADRVMRGQGNRSGRQRMRPDGSLRPMKPPRGLILSTGEDIPRGASLRARMMIIDVAPTGTPGGIDLDRLSPCQRDAGAGLYAQSMAGFLAWIAPQYDWVVSDLKAGVVTLRDAVIAKLGALGHGRTATIVADLLAGIAVFLRFAVEIGAITADEAEALRARFKHAIMAVARDQAAHHADADPCQRYLTLLASALGAGKCHVATTDGTMPNDVPALWGWKSEEVPSRDGPPGTTWRSQGPRIGWVDGDDLYLDPDSAYAEVQKLATAQGDAFPLTKNTLAKRLHERGSLLGTDKGRLTAQKTIEGRQRRCLHLPSSMVGSPPQETGNQGPSEDGAPKPQDVKPLLGGVSQFLEAIPKTGLITSHLTTGYYDDKKPLNPVKPLLHDKTPPGFCSRAKFSADPTEPVADMTEPVSTNELKAKQINPEYSETKKISLDAGNSMTSYSTESGFSGFSGFGEPKHRGKRADFSSHSSQELACPEKKWLNVPPPTGDSSPEPEVDGDGEVIEPEWRPSGPTTPPDPIPPGLINDWVDAPPIRQTATCPTCGFAIFGETCVECVRLAALHKAPKKGRRR